MFQNTYFILNSALIISSISGILLNHRNLLKILLSVELILLIINLNFLTLSLKLDDASGYLYSFLILAIAACESAIGIAIVILYFKNRSDITLIQKAVLRY